MSSQRGEEDRMAKKTRKKAKKTAAKRKKPARKKAAKKKTAARKKKPAARKKKPAARKKKAPARKKPAAKKAPAKPAAPAPAMPAAPAGMMPPPAPRPETGGMSAGVRAYCMACGAERELKNVQITRTPDGRLARKGNCSVCGSEIVRAMP
jgi:hypothetical protein